MRYRKNQRAIESCLAKGRKPPKWYTDEPLLGVDVGLEEYWYIGAFWDLSTERDQGEVVGDVPWSAAMAYAAHKGIPVEDRDQFWTIVQLMDRGYQEYLRGEYDVEARSQGMHAKVRAARKGAYGR